MLSVALRVFVVGMLCVAGNAAAASPDAATLQAIEATEERDLAKAAQLLDGLGINGGKHLASQLEAFKWAAKIRPAS